MKKIIILFLFLFIGLKVYSQGSGSLISKPLIDEYNEKNKNEKFLKYVCTHFYFEDRLYLLSYSNLDYDKHLSNDSYKNKMYLWDVENKSTCSAIYYGGEYESAPVFLGLKSSNDIGFGITVDFVDFPQEYNYGKSLIDIINNEYVLITQTYYFAFDRSTYYRYPVFLLLKKINHPIFEFEIITRYFPEQINGNYAKQIKKINDSEFNVEMENGQIFRMLFNVDNKFIGFVRK